MYRFLSFWWQCIAASARDSIAPANAWAPVLGAFILWAALRVAGWELIVPDHLPGLILIAIFCLASAWLVVFLLRFIFVEPVRRHTLAVSEVMSLRQRLAERTNATPSARPNTRHDALRILVGDSPPFEETQTFQTSGTQRRTIRVGIRNDGNGFLSNCTVHIRSIWPTWEDTEVPILLASGFTLMPDEIKYIDIAAFDEHLPSSPLYGNNIVICKPPGTEFAGYIFIPVNYPPHAIAIEARSLDASEFNLLCKLWIDRNSGQPRLRVRVSNGSAP
jgi:hypothetical protein